MNMEKLIAYAIEAIILTCCLIQSSKVIYFIILYGVRFFLGGMGSLLVKPQFGMTAVTMSILCSQPIKISPQSLGPFYHFKHNPFPNQIYSFHSLTCLLHVQRVQ